MITRRTFAAGTAAALAAPMLSRRARAAETWRHAILASKGDAAFFFMPKHKGFWEKRGLDVEIIELKGSKDVMRAVLANEAESADPTVFHGAESDIGLGERGQRQADAIAQVLKREQPTAIVSWPVDVSEAKNS